MKTMNLLFLALLLCCSIELDAQQHQHPLVGTWEMVSGKGTDTEQKKIKTDFTWRVEGDKFIQQGTILLPDGKQVSLDELVFQRVKSDQPYADNPSIVAWDQLSSSYIMADDTKNSQTSATKSGFDVTDWACWAFY